LTTIESRSVFQLQWRPVMRIRNFYLIVSLLGIFAQSPLPAQESIQAVSPAISATIQGWRTYTKVTSIQALTTQGDYLWAGTNGGVVRWNTNDDSYVKYTTADGLAGNVVTAIASDLTGKLWVGTLEYGASKFDGTNWTTYTTASGLAGDSINAIASDSAGNVWIGTGYYDGAFFYGLGVSKFDGVNWTNYNENNGLAGNNITSIAVDSIGNIWFGTGYECSHGGQCGAHGVSKFDGSTWTNYTTADGLAGDYITAIASDLAGNMWFGTAYGGVSKFDGTTWTTYLDMGLIDRDALGNVWFITNDGLSKFDGTSFTTYTKPDGLPGYEITAIASDPAGNVWVGTNEGLSKFDGSTWATYTTADPLAGNYVNAIASDPMGNLWIAGGDCYEYGCFDNGVSRFDGTNWTTYTTADGLAGDWITAIAVDKDGNMWFGTAGCSVCSSNGVSRFDGTHWTTYTTADGLADNYVVSIASDPNGNLWFGSREICPKLGCVGSHGVSKFDGINWTTYTTADGLADNSVTTIASDAHGNLWFGTPGKGVSKFDGASWTTYTTADGLSSDEVNAIASDAGGNLWFGTNEGVSKFDGVNWTTYNTANGGMGRVTAITSDLVGNIWAGGYGVNKFDGTSWATYTTINGLADNRILALESDPAGNLWSGTYGGLSELYIVRRLSSNYARGAPGSFFNLSGDHFPANQSVLASINGASLGNIPISSNGVFTFTLSTDNAGEGLYIVKVGNRPSVQVQLRLDAQEPIQPKEGDYRVIDIPAGIALTPRFYLPALWR
jgi:ligand-binding sensor domain-containing protein